MSCSIGIKKKKKKTQKKYERFTDIKRSKFQGNTPALRSRPRSQEKSQEILFAIIWVICFTVSKNIYKNMNFFESGIDHFAGTAMHLDRV